MFQLPQNSLAFARQFYGTYPHIMQEPQIVIYVYSTPEL